MGLNTMFPLTGISRKQTCVSHSTPEAEIVAADVALRTTGIPAAILWDNILQRPMRITFHEDNQAAMRVMLTGRNPTMRHIGRTHKLDVAWLAEQLSGELFDIVYEVSTGQRADIFTKGFDTADKWEHARSMINVLDVRAKLLPPPVHGGGGSCDETDP